LLPHPPDPWRAGHRGEFLVEVSGRRRRSWTISGRSVLAVLRHRPSQLPNRSLTGVWHLIDLASHQPTAPVLRRRERPVHRAPEVPATTGERSPDTGWVHCRVVDGDDNGRQWSPRVRGTTGQGANTVATRELPKRRPEFESPGPVWPAPHPALKGQQDDAEEARGAWLGQSCAFGGRSASPPSLMSPARPHDQCYCWYPDRTWCWWHWRR
jgi:hypothetical protein